MKKNNIPTKEQVLEAAKECITVERALRKLWPQYFEGTIELRSVSGHIRDQNDEIVCWLPSKQSPNDTSEFIMLSSRYDWCVNNTGYPTLHPTLKKKVKAGDLFICTQNFRSTISNGSFWENVTYKVVDYGYNWIHEQSYYMREDSPIAGRILVTESQLNACFRKV